jgi:hypothetical protein
VARAAREDVLDARGRSARARLREVHAVAPRILAHVADDVGELEGDGRALRVLERARVAIAEDRRGELAHDAGHAVAIELQRVEVGIAMVGEVHLHAVDDLVQRAASMP